MGWNPFIGVKSFFKAARSNGFAFAIQRALGSGQAGAWRSDHRTESDNYTGWTYVAVRAICSQLMQASVSVYDEQNRGGSRVVQKNLYASEDGEATPLPNTHPLCKILKRPNPTQSGAMFRFECGLQLQLTGSCIIWNVPNKFGKPVQRYVIPTALATPIQPTSEFPEGGYRISSTASRYVLVDEDGFTTSGLFNEVVGKVIPLAQLQVIRWPHPIWKDDGQSPVSAGAKWIDSANQVDQARWAQMNNGADPSVVVTYGKDINPTQDELDAAVKKFEDKYSGTENTGKAMFTTGERATALTTTPKDMSYKEAFDQMRDSIMALHGVPGIAAGLAEGGSYAAFYASLKQFVCLTVQPILELLAEEDTEQLAPFFGKGLIVEMEAASIDDPDVLNSELQTDAGAGTITYNEYRAARGRPPISADEGGDKLISTAQSMLSQPTATPFSTGNEGPPQPNSYPDEIEPEKPELIASPKDQDTNADQAKGEVKNVQATALNGAQVTSLVQLATALSTNQLPHETVRKLIEAAFPLMEPTLIDDILRPLLNFDPPFSPETQKSCLHNDEAMQKARQIVRSFRDYPGGNP